MGSSAATTEAGRVCRREPDDVEEIAKGCMHSLEASILDVHLKHDEVHLCGHDAGLERSGGALSRKLELEETGLLCDTAERALVGEIHLLALSSILLDDHKGIRDAPGLEISLAQLPAPLVEVNVVLQSGWQGYR